MTARDDYPAMDDWVGNMQTKTPAICVEMARALDEIDQLRAVRDAAKTLTDRCWEKGSTSGVDDLLAALWRSLPEDHR